MTTEQLEKIKRDLTILTDEAEGTQSISLDLINICDPDADNTVGPLDGTPEEILKDIELVLDGDDVIIYSVIEFGDDYVLGDKLQYRLEVKPGPIKVGLVIATIVLNGVTKKIKSKFEGVVLGEDDEYEHLYPNASRHIIIKECKKCNLNDDVSLENLADKFPSTGDFNYNPEDPEDPLVKIQEKFKLNSELYNLIKDNICESKLPSILCNRSTDANANLKNGKERFIEYYYYTGSVSSTHDKHPEKTDKGYKKSDIALCSNTTLGNILSLMLGVNINSNIFWSDVFQDLCSEENIEKCKDDKSKSGVDIDKLNAIADDIQAVREYYIQEVIKQYNEKTKKVALDNSYNDCKYLAYPNVEILTSETLCMNYYVNLLTRLNMSTESTYTIKYRDLLLDIINNRQSCEYYSKNKLIKDFNKLLQERIGAEEESEYYKDILAEFKNGEKHMTFDDAKTIISKYFDENNVPFIDDLVNLCVFITTMKTTMVKYKEANDYNYYDETVDEDGNVKYKLKEDYAYELVKDEKRKLESFWNDILKLYEDCSIENCKKELLAYIAKQTGTNADGDSSAQYVDASWPMRQVITVNKQTYDLYVFENRNEPDMSMYDDGSGNGNGNNDRNNGLNNDDEQAEKMKEADEPLQGEITVFDCTYWYLYFALATVISLPLVMDWADGIDIPTPVGILSIPLPGIYICIACLPIQIFNIVIVFGLAIRGMWIFPIILVVNMSSTAINFLLPLKIAVEKLKEIFSKQIENMEGAIGNLADVLIYQFEELNKQLRIQNKQYEVYKAALKSLQLENKALIKKGFEEAYMADADHRQVITRLEKLKDVPFKHEAE